MKMSLSTVKSSAKLAFGKSKLLLKKYAPDILVATGTVAIVGGTVLACKATLKASDVLAEHEEEMQYIRDAINLDDDTKYSAEDVKKDKIIVYTQTSLKFLKLYALPVTLITTGIGCILTAHGIMKKRNLALMSMYSALQESLNKYRERVRAAVGEEKEKLLYYNADSLTSTDVVDPNTGEVIGKEATLGGEKIVLPSVYSRIFDETNPEWQKSSVANKTFLTSTQAWCNVLLQKNGHLFLNEVYKMLGFPETSYGALAGWLKDEGDGVVDFGIFNIDDPKYGQKRADFINGFERSVVLDFNVCGLIYDKI